MAFSVEDILKAMPVSDQRHLKQIWILRKLKKKKKREEEKKEEKKKKPKDGHIDIYA